MTVGFAALTCARAVLSGRSAPDAWRFLEGRLGVAVACDAYTEVYIPLVALRRHERRVSAILRVRPMKNPAMSVRLGSRRVAALHAGIEAADRLVQA